LAIDYLKDYTANSFLRHIMHIVPFLDTRRKSTF
jgi:hypothetical protein